MSLPVAGPSVASLVDLPEDVLLFLLSRTNDDWRNELSPKDLARLEAVCYSLRRPLLLPPNRRHSIVESAARIRCLRHPLFARVPPPLLRQMAVQRCGGSWLRVLRFAWAMEEAWGMRRRDEGRRPGWEEQQEYAAQSARAVYAGDYCSFHVKTNGDLWVYGTGTRDGAAQFDPSYVPSGLQQQQEEEVAPNLQQALASQALTTGQVTRGFGAAAAAPDPSLLQRVSAAMAVMGGDRGGGNGVGRRGGERRGNLRRLGILVPRERLVVGRRIGESLNSSLEAVRESRLNGRQGEAFEGVRSCGGSDPIVQVCGGRTFTVFVTESGVVYTMGQDSSGCCGHGPDGVGKRFNTPKLVAGLAGVPIQQVATGRSHTIALARDGTVYTFGAGGNGRLGHGDTEDRSVPTVVEGLRGERLRETLCMVRERMTQQGAATKSSNSSSSSRSSTDTSSSSSAPDTTSPSASDRIVHVAAGNSHCLAVTAGGALLAFGRGHSGQLGGAQALWQPGELFESRAPWVGAGRGEDILLSDCHAPGVVGSFLEGGVHVMRVAASTDYSAAIDCLGRLFMWGSGYCGCLGNGSELNEVRPSLVEGLLHTRVVQVTLSKRKTLALDDCGRVFAFGWSAFGGLGMESGQDKVLQPTEVDKLKRHGGKVVQVSTGAYHTVALCCNGQVVGFGDNEQGQLDMD